MQRSELVAHVESGYDSLSGPSLHSNDGGSLGLFQQIASFGSRRESKVLTTQLASTCSDQGNLLRIWSVSYFFVKVRARAAPRE